MTRDEARAAITKQARAHLQQEGATTPNDPSKYWIAIYAARVLCDHAEVHIHGSGEHAMCNICGGQT